jgi:hypothetical protein
LNPRFFKSLIASEIGEVAELLLSFLGVVNRCVIYKAQMYCEKLQILLGFL